ncbi:hypothetical protein EYS14_15270 [Alteromonadaceae bacterium M269]|nr:hypothetical protein EYS14_15270 [Alteromonadaceae bacterium M269]
MRFMNFTYIFFLSFSSVLAANESSNDQLVSQAIGASLQGDTSAALNYLAKVEAPKLNQKSELFYNCMHERFGNITPTKNTSAVEGSLTAKLTKLFRNYWHKSLGSPDSRNENGIELDNKLKEELGLDKDATPAELDDTIRSKLKKEGNYALLGQTGVLRELMIWSKEERKQESVKMPHGNYKTSVVYLDEFIEAGWAMYATCEQRGTGGWVAEKTLYAVVPRYKDIKSEVFSVTFLGHETQHFLDLDKYDDLQSWELEYRAKLMELSMADKTQTSVLRKFIEDQRNDASYPHSYANYKLLKDLVSTLALSTPNDLYNVDREHLNNAAITLFNADTISRH